MCHQGLVNYNIVEYSIDEVEKCATKSREMLLLWLIQYKARSVPLVAGLVP
jgi:hypothetical protein